jgi:hypothetical protein
MDELKVELEKIGPVGEDEMIMATVDPGDLDPSQYPSLLKSIVAKVKEFFPDAKVMAKGTNMDVHPVTKVVIASELLSIREPVLKLAKDMEEKLRKHDKERGFFGWRNDKAVDLVPRIYDEMIELSEKVSRVHNGKGDLLENVKLAKKECADAANFCMMIHDLLSVMEANAAGGK